MNSFDAVSWALKQEGMTPSAKFVLVALAARINDQGQCFPSRETVAKETAQSVDTVDRRFRDLEALGFIAREHRKRDNGSYTSSMITLLFDGEKLDRDLRENRTGKPTGEAAPEEDGVAANCGQVAADCGEGGRTDAARVAATVRHPEQPLNNQSNPSSPSESQPVPAASAGERDASQNSSEQAEKRWREFDQAFPWRPSMPKAVAKQLFLALTVKDQEKCVRAVVIFAANCRADNRKYPPISAEQFIRTREFDHIAEAKREAAKQGQSVEFVEAGTDGWKAWHRHDRAKYGWPGEEPPPTYFAKSRDGTKRGVWKPTLFPPKSEATGPPSSKPKPPDEDIHVDF